MNLIIKLCRHTFHNVNQLRCHCRVNAARGPVQVCHTQYPFSVGLEPQKIGKPLGRIIYECYKPRNISETREYIDFMLTQRSILPNELQETEHESEVSPVRQSDFSFEPSQIERQKYSENLLLFLKTEHQKRQGTFFDIVCASIALFVIKIITIILLF